MPTFVLSWTEYRMAVVEAANAKAAAQQGRSADVQATNAMSSVSSYEDLQIETWGAQRVPVDEDAGICCPQCGCDVAFVTAYTAAATGERITGVSLPVEPGGLAGDHAGAEALATCDACGHTAALPDFLYDPTNQEAVRDE
jgi:hypothetical protein